MADDMNEPAALTELFEIFGDDISSHEFDQALATKRGVLRRAILGVASVLDQLGVEPLPPNSESWEGYVETGLNCLEIAVALKLDHGDKIEWSVS